MKSFVVWLACVASLYMADGALAPFIVPCHESDAACHRTSAQNVVSVFAAGVKDLGMEPLDPLMLKKVHTDQAGLKMEFRDTVVKGLRNCKVLSLSRRGMKTNMELQCSPTLLGDYTIAGRLLILPVEGHGRYKIKIRDIIVKVSYDLVRREQNGVPFWRLNAWEYSSTVKTGAEFHFQNLFNGNKQLSDTVHQFANSNWKEIFDEVAPPIVKAIVAKIIGEVRKLFDKVPISELALD